VEARARAISSMSDYVRNIKKAAFMRLLLATLTNFPGEGALITVARPLARDRGIVWRVMVGGAKVCWSLVKKVEAGL